MKHLAVFLLVTLCLGLWANEPTSYENDVFSPDTTLDKFVLEAGVQSPDFYFPNFTELVITDDPETFNCKCSGYLWGSHSVTCGDGQGCVCNSGWFDCECKCDGIDEPHSHEPHTGHGG
ncbi:MAG: hypothetical protein AAFW00_12930 [Bacteroidota bacterium]